MNNEELTQQLLNEFNKSIENKDDERSINNNNDDESVSSDEPNVNGQSSFGFTWIEGLRTGSRLVWVPSEECIYYSNAVSIKHSNAIACTCYIDNCTERILISENGTAKKNIHSKGHNHGSLYVIYKERFLYTFMKERCRQAPASATIRDIYNEAVVL